jgi:hypothetical protein
MSKKAHDEIAEGLAEALPIARGQKKPARIFGVLDSREPSLTGEQLAEVRRRRADPNRKLVSHHEARKRIKRLGK